MHAINPTFEMCYKASTTVASIFIEPPPNQPEYQPTYATATATA